VIKSAGILWAALLIASCVSGGGSYAVFNVDQVISNETTLIGRTVTVSGYLRFGDDTRNLWANKAAHDAVVDTALSPDDPAWNRCVALFDIDGWRDVLLKNDRRQILVRGILRRDPQTAGEITMSECSELGLSIRSVVRR
jgi:hypothetical protein